MESKAWRLLFTKPRGEEDAARNLKDQGYEVYLPRLKAQKRVRGEYREIIEPLFPRYLFIHLIAGVDNWSPIRSTPGVSNLVRFGDRYASLPERIIEDLRQREDTAGLIPLKPPALDKGDRVRILDGPFQDIEAIIYARSGEERVILLLNIAGKEAKVQTSIHLLAPVG
ncbi:MAG: transcription/translation regulatory transformer protein RfaH [Gammaproteobacteria bacterium]|nr:transcription/translation regulatory transformer protein RfaH [Gammaproteobacteria bacterium]MBU1656180.1 transcription/translation regulatory transformer protein RfaH [Gammaproteobacteria bacterium]MBU1961313.1 transcription/translation regulatory transformer protein RfaH [Gammaproteobacteria bacterium]